MVSVDDDCLMGNFVDNDCRASVRQFCSHGTATKRQGEPIRLEGLNDDVMTATKNGQKAAGKFNSV